MTNYFLPNFIKTKDVLFGQTITTGGLGGLNTIKSTIDNYLEVEDDYTTTLVNSNTTLTATSVYTAVNTLIGNIVITLPPASPSPKQPITIYNSNANSFTCTIQRAGSDTITSPYSGLSVNSFILENNDMVCLYPDGTNWITLNSSGITTSSGIYEVLIQKGNSQSITATTATKITFGSILSDPNGLWVSASDKLVAPSNIYLQIVGRIDLQVANSCRQVQLFKNTGSGFAFDRVLYDFNRNKGATTTTKLFRSFFNLVQLNAGNEIDIRMTSDAQPYTIGANSQIKFLIIPV